MGVFEEAYEQLNQQQRAAVDTIDGPVMVVAGPGTGKTQLLSLRVANILRKTDVDASSILCLTFTNKAAVNMRERILKQTGGKASGVLVKTFHSFAAELMNMYPDYFWNGARLTTAPDAVQLDIIQTILSRLPLNNPLALKFAGNFTAGHDVLKALRYAKEAGLTPKKLEALTQANLAYLDEIEPQLVDILQAPLSAKSLDILSSRINALPEQGISDSLQPLQDLGKVIKESLSVAITLDAGSSKTTNTGKWKQRWVQAVEQQKGMHKERERNSWWLHVSGVYQSYRDELHKRGYYDYSDMLVEVITQLSQRPALRADVQEKFLYVLIDEFQDTNAAQLQLAHLIADHPEANGKPNLMVVGDDDQSIYKFNGAELNNMLSFQKSYPSCKVIILSDNYRSTQTVLDTASKVIQQASDRLVTREPSLKKNLTARSTTQTGGTLAHFAYPSEEQELSDIADRISKVSKSSDQSQAVLARDHASLRRMAALLTQRNIPVRYEQQNNILEDPVVKQIYVLCSLLLSIQSGDVQTTNSLLSELLRSPIWKLKPETLWHLAITARKNGNWLNSMGQSTNQDLKTISMWLLWLSGSATTEPLQVVLEYVIGLRASEHLTSPLREYYLVYKKASSEYLRALSAVRLLLASARDFARTNTAELEDFVNFIRVSRETGETIADESVFVTGPNAVQLLTVHKAKGLEFDWVYIINAIDSSWRPSSVGRKPPANLPLQPAGDDSDDYARLMFVATTRAKHSIIVASYRTDQSGKEIMASPLATESFETTQIDSKNSEDSIVLLEEHIAWPHLNSDDEKLNLRDQLENFSLSATSLIDFLDVSQGGPQLFFERHLLRLPEVTSSSMAFGSAIHKALEYAQVLTNTTGLDRKKVALVYQTTLHNQQLPAHEEERFLEHGLLLLNKLFDSETFWLGKGSLAEQTLADIRIGKAVVNGKLDRIDTSKESLTIVDYKTGKPLGSFTTRDKTKAVKAWRHRTQLIFYSLLLQQSPRFSGKQTIGQMWYLEASQPKELIREYIPTAEEIETMAQLIEVVYKKIVMLSLPDTTNYSPDFDGIQKFVQDLLQKKI